MSAIFAPWIEGASVPELDQAVSSEKPHLLHLVPSTAVQGGNDESVNNDSYEISSVYEKVLIAGIKVVAVLLLFCCVALVGLGIGFAAQGQTHAVIVQPGDSLYSIAASVPNSPSLSVTADDIRFLNGLDTDVIYEGQKLILPEY